MTITPTAAQKPPTSVGYQIGFSIGHWIYIQIMTFISQMNFVTESPVISNVLFHPFFFAFRQVWDFCKGIWESLVPNLVSNHAVISFAMKITNLCLRFVQSLLESFSTTMQAQQQAQMSSFSAGQSSFGAQGQMGKGY